VAPILGGADGKTGSCGGCHSVSGGVGPGFLEPKPDMLTTMLSYPGMIGSTPDTSRIYAKGTHEGPALTVDQKPIVAAWIVEWNMYKPMAMDGGTSKPIIAPFTPAMGPNTIDISVLDPTLAGQTVTFTASKVGTSLELSQITIKTSASMGVHMVHPLWVLWDAQYNATPDPVDSFSNLDETVFQGDTKPMGPGTLLLANYTDQKLNIVFTLLEAKVGSTDGGSVQGCKNVMSFTNNVRATLSANCAGCHTNGNGAGALSMAMMNDLSATGQAGACLNMRGEVDVNTPANSRMYKYPDPNSGITHPFKFQAGALTTFMNSANTWINLEK
jgi:hypothetical protein